MAIALVGTPTTAHQGSGTSLVLNYPSHTYTPGTGQVAIAFIFGVSGVISATGWTAVANSTIVAGGASVNVFRRTLDGSEGASATFSSSDSSIVFLGNMRLYSGVNTTTPLDTAGSNPQFGVGLTGQATVTGFTTVQDGDELIFFAYDWDRAATLGTPSGYGNASLVSGAAEGQASGSWDQAQATHASTGSVTTSAMTSGDHWGAVLIAIQAAAGTVTNGAIPHYKLITKRWRTARPKAKSRRLNMRETSPGMLLFSPVAPLLPNLMLRQDKPKPPPKFRRIVRIPRHFFPYDILLFYFLAIRHVKRRYQSTALPPKWKKVFDHPPYRWGIGYYLITLPLPRRMRAAKIKVKRWVRRKVFRNFGTFAPVSPAFYVALIRRDLPKLRVRKVRPLPQRRRILSGASLLFQAALPRRRKSRPLKFPLRITATPMSPHERIRRVIANAQAIIVAIVPLHFRRARLTRPKPKPQKPRMLQRAKHYYSGFVAQVGATLDAIVMWRNRGGH